MTKKKKVILAVIIGIIIAIVAGVFVFISSKKDTNQTKYTDKPVEVEKDTEDTCIFRPC